MGVRIIGRRGVLAGASGILASPAIVRAQGQTAGVALVIARSGLFSQGPPWLTRQSGPRPTGP